MVEKKIDILDIARGVFGFFEDLEQGLDTQEKIDEFMKKNKLTIEMEENSDLIYFKLMKKNQPYMYSRPILKYDPETRKGMRFYMDDGTCVTSDRLPIYNYNKMRKGLITPAESREQDKSAKKLANDLKRLMGLSVDEED